MVGKNFIEIGANDFLRGMSSSAELTDAGFSPETEGINPFLQLGVLHFPAPQTDRSTDLTGTPIAWCSTSVDNINGYIIGSTGVIHSVSTSTTLTAAAGLTGTWTAGTTDIVQFIDKIYATSTTDVARMDVDLTNGDHDWWSATQSEGVLTSGVRHPLLIYQDRLWVGDRNSLHKITDSSNTDQDVLLLSTHWEITALGIDPSTGKMLIAASQGTNGAGTIANANAIFIWDGTSATYLRQINVDATVYGFHDVGGTVYVGYGFGKIGYWNGAGVTFLRSLSTITTSTIAQSTLPYKHHLTHIDNTLYVIDGTQVIAFGDILSGRKIWFPVTTNELNSNNLSLIAPLGTGLLGLGFAGPKLYSYGTRATTAGGSKSFFTNYYRFPKPVFIRSVFVEYADPVADADTAGSFYYRNKSAIGTSDTWVQLSSLTNSSGSAIGETANEILGAANDKGRTFQFKFTQGTTRYGISRFIIYFDPAE